MLELRPSTAKPCHVLVAAARLCPELELGISGQVLVGVFGEGPQRG